MNRMAMVACVAACLAVPAGHVAARVVHYSGFEDGCEVPDLDGDRLGGCVEASLKLDPALPDTDGDGLGDGDEVLGTADGLDLPAMGVDPRHKEVLLEYDWFFDDVEAGGNNCATPGGHSHRPTQAALDIVTVALGASPVPNPDKRPGIDVIHDVGQGGVFDGGSVVPDADGVINGSATGVEYFQKYLAHFALNRRGYFHYVLLPHRFIIPKGSGFSGSAQVADGYRRERIMVTLYCLATDRNVGHTILHELGHNFGLRHGGDSDCNNKPNYNSVMNYRYQLQGVDTGCDTIPDGVATYSTGSRIALDENALDESKGVCGNVPIDWTASNGIQTLVAANLNYYADEALECAAPRMVLRDHDDWSALEIGVDASVADAGEPVDEAAVCGAAP